MNVLGLISQLIIIETLRLTDRLHTHLVAHNQEPSLHPISMGGGMAFEIKLVGASMYR